MERMGGRKKNEVKLVEKGKKGKSKEKMGEK